MKRGTFSDIGGELVHETIVHQMAQAAFSAKWKNMVIPAIQQLLSEEYAGKHFKVGRFGFVWSKSGDEQPLTDEALAVELGIAGAVRKHPLDGCNHVLHIAVSGDILTVGIQGSKREIVRIVCMSDTQKIFDIMYFSKAYSTSTPTFKGNGDFDYTIPAKLDEISPLHLNEFGWAMFSLLQASNGDMEVEFV